MECVEYFNDDLTQQKGLSVSKLAINDATPADPTYSLYNATEYLTGDLLPNSGHVRVRVSPSSVIVDYIHAVLPKDDMAGHN